MGDGQRPTEGDIILTLPKTIAYLQLNKTLRPHTRMHAPIYALTHTQADGQVEINASDGPQNGRRRYKIIKKENNEYRENCESRRRQESTNDVTFWRLGVR